MSFTPDPTWSQQTLEANIKVPCSCAFSSIVACTCCQHDRHTLVSPHKRRKTMYVQACAEEDKHVYAHTHTHMHTQYTYTINTHYQTHDSCLFIVFDCISLSSQSEYHLTIIIIILS